MDFFDFLGSGSNTIPGTSIPFDWMNPGATQSFIDPAFTPGLEAAAGYPGATSALGGGFNWPSLPSGTTDLLSKVLGNPSIMGAALGAGAGALGGSPKPAGTITSVQDVPDWLKPYVMTNLAGASSVMSQINPFNPLLPQAQAEAGKTIGGAYLSPQTNPWLQDTYNQAAKAVTDSYLSTTQPRTDALFYKGGAFGPGNSAYEETVARNQFGLGQNLNNLATNIFGGNYNAERGRQATATFGAPGLVSGSANAAFAPFQAYSSLFPNVRATSEPYFSNPFAGILGGALGGYGLGKAFG